MLAMDYPLLNIKKVSKHFGGVTALNQVSFTVNKNQIKGLIGPNGAGKTTLFNLISGFTPLSSGEIDYRRQSILSMPAYQIAKKGIVRTFQNVKLFPNLTVLENIMVGGFSGSKTGLLSIVLNLPKASTEEFKLRGEALELLNFVGLAEQSALYASALPFGQQRLLEIARALSAKPELLLLDEPAAGLSTPERAVLGSLIRKIRDRGITILLVEHDMDLVMRVCEEIIVLEFGSKIAEGTPESIQNNRQVVAAYLGEEIEHATD
jgi:branched-chain amino acid transport system ATP-binding protein